MAGLKPVREFHRGKSARSQISEASVNYDLRNIFKKNYNLNKKNVIFVFFENEPQYFIWFQSIYYINVLLDRYKVSSRESF